VRAFARAEIQRFGAGPAYIERVPRPRIHDEPRVTTAVRLPTELHDRLRCAADERHVSVNFLIVKALEDYLDRLIPIDEVELTRPRAGS
jgi:hypothetical protein